MPSDEIIKFGGFQPSAELIADLVDEFTRQLTQGARAYAAEMKAGATEPRMEDEHDFLAYFRDLDVDQLVADAPSVDLKLEVADRVRRYSGLERCLNVIQSEDWTNADLNISSHEFVIIEGSSDVSDLKELRIVMGERDGYARLEFPSENARSAILAPLAEAARTFRRVSGTNEPDRTPAPARNFSFNEDVLKHPLLVNASSGLFGAFLGFAAGWLTWGR